jgi:homoserine kinase
MADSIRVFAPATVANLTCGFDILGLAINGPGDELVAKKTNGRGVTITSIDGDEGRLSKDAAKNTAGISASQFLQAINYEGGIEISLHKRMPFGSGMGSSAASAVAGVFAVNELLGRPMNQRELLRFAVEGERIACGSGHADNVAPSLLGGITLVRSYEPLEVLSLPVPVNMCVAVLHPAVEVSTGDARAILPKEVAMKASVKYAGNLAGFVSALYTSDLGLMRRALIDEIVEPKRASLIPHFYEIKGAALSSEGVIGFGISGSGPAMFALADGQEAIAKVGAVMESILKKRGISAHLYISEVNAVGPKILD